MERFVDFQLILISQICFLWRIIERPEKNYYFAFKAKIINQDFTEWALIDSSSSFSSFWNTGFTTPFCRLAFKSLRLFPSVSLSSSSLDSSLEVSFSSWNLYKKIVVRILSYAHESKRLFCGQYFFKISCIFFVTILKFTSTPIL